MHSYPVKPVLFHVFGTHFTYDKAGEVRIVTQRHWLNFGGVHQPGTVTVLKIRNVRGHGRQRDMRVERDVNTLWPLYNTGMWTDYHEDAPAGDYHVACDGSPGAETGSPVLLNDRHYALGTAEIDFCNPGEICTEDAVTYTHTNHLGTTRARTDDPNHGGPGIPTPFERPVYTAFGERIDGDLSTRYGYIGQHGYETFDGLDWGEWDIDGPGGNPPAPVPFAFIHTGARWYDPGTGRFLQRDPTGIEAEMNVHGYNDNDPLTAVDPDGLQFYPVWPGPGPAPQAPKPGPGGWRLKGGRWLPYYPPINPGWWEPCFAWSWRATGAVGAAAAVGAGTGVAVNYGVPAITGSRKRRLTDYIVDPLFEFFTGECPGC